MTSAPDASLPLHELRRVLKGQYGAALTRFRQAVEQCPDDLWFDERPTNTFWQVAYHTIFFADFYLQPTAEAFEPWERHQRGVQNEDGIAGPPDANSSLPLIPQPYSRRNVLDYCEFVERRLSAAVDGLDLLSAESGFSW